MKKLLFISNIAGNKGIDNFALANVVTAKKMRLEFHTAINYSSVSPEILDRDSKKYGVWLHHINFSRNPFSFSNFRAYKELVKLIEREGIDYIHCNTPIGGVLGRLVGKKCKVKKVIYQAHGFHFWKGAPLKNWLIYYPVEKWLAHYTDALITINKEDFERAQRFKLKNIGKVYYVPGVGIELSQYELPENTREKKRKELGLKETDVALISMGDLIERKNYTVAIEAIAKADNANLQYYICGIGPEEEKLRKQAEHLGVKEQIHFLGFRTDIKELLKAADIFLFTSKQEGLARSLMEAMASGLPCVASRIRGNTDLLEGTRCGYLCSGVAEYTEAITRIVQEKNLKQYSIECRKRIENFDMDSVIKSLKSVYKQVYR